MRRSVIAEDERTGHFKGCQVELVWLGPGAAHRVSQVCISALEVDQSTSECEGGDCKKRAFIVDSIMLLNGRHTPQSNTHTHTTFYKKSFPVGLI